MSRARKVLYVEGSGAINYSKDPAKNIGGSAISLYYLIRDLDEDRFSSTAYFNYSSFVIDRLCMLEKRIILNSGEKRKSGKTRNPVHVFFNDEQYRALSYQKSLLFKILPHALKMIRVLKEEKPDIVHCNNSLRLNMASLMAARVANIPCLCHVRCFEKLPFFNRFWARFVKYFICISEAVKRNYLLQGIQEDKLVVIPNGLDLADYSSEGPKREGSGIVVASIGRMVAWKGFDVLLDAIPLIVKKIPDIKFWIVGDGPEKSNLEKRTVTLGIDKYVVFKNTEPGVQRLLSDADLLVHTSIKPEPFGRVIIEAMSMQRPVIATDLGGPREIITHNRDGILIEPGRPSLLAEAVVRVLNDRGLRQKLGREARRTVERNFDHKTTVRRIESLYERI